MPAKLKISPGSKYGKLTVTSEADGLRIPSGQKIRRFNCSCECGNQKTVLLLHLIRGRISSCGCIKNVLGGESNTLLCKVWKGMIRRCTKEYFESHLYYKKGIRVCDEWMSWLVFRDWSLNNGYKKGLQIDRRDNSRGYSPDNCRWVTCKINTNNRDNTIRVVYNGQYQPIKLVLESVGKEKNYNTIIARIKRGWDAQTAIDTPIRIGNFSKTNFGNFKGLNSVNH